MVRWHGHGMPAGHSALFFDYLCGSQSTKSRTLFLAAHGLDERKRARQRGFRGGCSFERKERFSSAVLEMRL